MPSNHLTSAYSPPHCRWPNRPLPSPPPVPLLTHLQVTATLWQSWPRHGSHSSLNNSLHVHHRNCSIMASSASSTCCKHGIKVHLMVHFIMATKCISPLTESLPSSFSQNSFNQSIQVHLRTNLITVQIYPTMSTWYCPISASPKYHNHSFKVHTMIATGVSLDMHNCSLQVGTTKTFNVHRWFHSDYKFISEPAQSYPSCLPFHSHQLPLEVDFIGVSRCSYDCTQVQLETRLTEGTYIERLRWILGAILWYSNSSCNCEIPISNNDKWMTKRPVIIKL